jgi:nucleoside deoxyribosyltransferase
MKTIYLAGFDVFRRMRSPGASTEGALRAARLRRAVSARQGGAAGLSGPDTAQWIYEANVALIRRADIVMANLDDFRGPGEPDSGTAFEVGFAVALQKPVWAMPPMRAP